MPDNFELEPKHITVQSSEGKPSNVPVHMPEASGHQTLNAPAAERMNAELPPSHNPVRYGQEVLSQIPDIPEPPAPPQ